MKATAIHFKSESCDEYLYCIEGILSISDAEKYIRDHHPDEVNEVNDPEIMIAYLNTHDTLGDPF